MYKVLIADDEAIIRKGLISLIDWNEYGCEIIGEAANGRDALRIINEENPDIVMIDIRMPGMYGLETIKNARAQGFTGQVIILSGYSEFSYAQEAIKLGVSVYLTKPVDEDSFISALSTIIEELHSTEKKSKMHEKTALKAKDTFMIDFLTGKDTPVPEEMAFYQLDADMYQVVFYEKYSHSTTDIAYDFMEILSVMNQNHIGYHFLTIDQKNVILLKGSHVINRFKDLLHKYTMDNPPEKNSPLDTVFITTGRIVKDCFEIPVSYNDALDLLKHRFFADQHQHVMQYEELASQNAKPSDEFSKNDKLNYYVTKLVDGIQAFNRNNIADTLREIERDLYNAPLSIVEEKNFLVDIYLAIKEKITYLYRTTDIPFGNSSDSVNKILQSYYLYEIILFLSEQSEMIINSFGYSSRDSIISDIVHYIDHNYSENITLENIAPLFGYNSSYLGKIFSKKMGINFNTYLDSVRIEHSKELLKKEKMQVYMIAEMVGYRNVDYFHIKFKKSTGMSPAEYRKKG